MMTPHYEDDDVTLYAGDCIEVMRGLPDSSVDAVVTDPPYNLSDSSKRESDCLTRRTLDVVFPHHDQGDAERFERSDFAAPTFMGAPLRGVGGAIGVETRVGVPEGAVDFDDTTVVKHEVNTGNVPTKGAANADLPPVANPEGIKGLGHFILYPRHGWDAAICNGTCRCFGEPGFGLLTVTVVVPCSAGGDCLGCAHGPTLSPFLGDRVGLGDDALGESEAATEVMTLARAEHRAVLRLDVRRGTGELNFTDRAREGRTEFLLVPTVDVRALTGTGDLPSVLESDRIGVVVDGTDWTFALHEFPHAYQSSAGGFMGKDWDGWTSPAAFERWCVEWATEALRVLKPGGHLVAFGGTRTWHRLACAIEDAGFEIRDCCMFMYGSGFPKSLDVSKAIDKAAGAQREKERVPYGTNVMMQGIGVERPWMKAAAEVGYHERPGTTPATAAAQQWQGWGTALKPAYEPIVLARKPLAGTVAATVLEHGTGALNIDGCRVGVDGGTTRGTGGQGERMGDPAAGFRANPAGVAPIPAGRWPPNVILDEAAAAMLDAQSGDRKGSASQWDLTARSNKPGHVFDLAQRGLFEPRYRESYNDSGGASRFFYTAKAGRDERPNVDGIAHPTVKPLDLMRWLVRLVTPPGGVVLEPFAGSGTTAEACVVEGFRCIAIEREADYLPLIVQRLTKPIERTLL